ncbi:hypothetical protein GCM10009549_20710 [Streptomyces thermoalcalitolerans]|uniref:Uncharacterized protein n=1 Tax=Streptomyces thermoalcalitolerans TaxID=65605 RepID=A0ABN1NL21_9ACTN
MAALGVGQLYLVPDLERPAAAGGTGRFGHATSLPVLNRPPDHAEADGRPAAGPGRRPDPAAGRVAPLTGAGPTRGPFRHPSQEEAEGRAMALTKACSTSAAESTP